MLVKNVLAALVLAAALTESALALAAPRTGYAAVNGLSMYYEVHGSGHPLVLLHGALMTIENFGDILPGLAANRQVIAVEQQAHGRTKDIDRPLRYQQMADDTAALLRQLRVQDADVVGYSMGGGVALQLAVRHPDLVRKLVIVSSAYSDRGIHPGPERAHCRVEARGLCRQSLARDLRHRGR